jgi:hypothetical protein
VGGRTIATGVGAEDEVGCALGTADRDPDCATEAPRRSFNGCGENRVNTQAETIASNAADPIRKTIMIRVELASFCRLGWVDGGSACLAWPWRSPEPT